MLCESAQMNFASNFFPPDPTLRFIDRTDPLLVASSSPPGQRTARVLPTACAPRQAGTPTEPESGRERGRERGRPKPLETERQFQCKTPPPCEKIRKPLSVSLGSSYFSAKTLCLPFLATAVNGYPGGAFSITVPIRLYDAVL